jgi:hypothetical protein
MIDVLLLSDAIRPEDWERILSQLSKKDIDILEDAIVVVSDYYYNKGYDESKLFPRD